MTTVITDDLRLHREAGSTVGGWIWFSHRGQQTAYPMAPASFVSQEWVHAAPVVRLLGTVENAPLIDALYRARHMQGTPGRIQVGSPWPYDLDAERPDALTIFSRMLLLDHLRPSQGGWHDLTRHDYVSYSLCQSIFEARGRCTGIAEKFLKAHPAWPALSFLPTLDQSRAALMLALLVDPRWYIDPENPDRSARLKSYFGLGCGRGDASPIRLMEAILDQKRLSPELTRKAAKIQIVLDTWAGLDRDPDPLGAIGHHPRNFLWRVALEAPSRAVGLVRACHVFLRFLSEFWVSAVSGGHPDLFVPELFFRDPAIGEEWHNHRRNQVVPEPPDP